MKRINILKKQNSRWDITTVHKFNYRHYQVDKEGNFYRNGKIATVKPDAKLNKWFMLVDDEGVHVRFKAHQIILQTYMPNGLIDGVSVDHIDRNRLNNNLSNLRYATHKEQYKNRDNKECKYKKVKCLNNGKTYDSSQHAEIDLGLVKNTVSRVARGDRKSIHGYTFKFI